MGLCDQNCVILRTNGARCTLIKEIHVLLNKESVSGMHSGMYVELVNPDYLTPMHVREVMRRRRSWFQLYTHEYILPRFCVN